MSAFPTEILLATDGSEHAKLAAKTAIELSTKLSSQLCLIYVAPEHPYTHGYYDLCHQHEEERFLRDAQKALDEYVKHIREAGGTIAQAYIRVGDAAKEIVELAEELNFGLVVLGSRGHGRLRRALMGSVSTSVLRHSHCSVLVVRGYGSEEDPGKLEGGTILVAIDGSEEASAAAQAATEVAKATGSELHLMYAMQEERYRPHLGPEMWEGWEEGFEQAKRSARSWVEEQAEHVRAEGPKNVEAHLMLGRPDAATVWLAEELEVALVVVGSRGLGGMSRTLLGSVSASVVAHAPYPVMVVRLEKEQIV
jgi:nucleotide-binding universal stress UspA family protein